MLMFPSAVLVKKTLGTTQCPQGDRVSQLDRVPVVGKLQHGEISDASRHVKGTGKEQTCWMIPSWWLPLRR